MTWTLLKSAIGRYHRNRKGNIAMIAALAIIPIVAVAGFAVDFQLIETRRSKLQHTLDAAVLNGARALRDGMSETDVRTEVRNYFTSLQQANEPNVTCGVVNVVFSQAIEEVSGNVTCTHETVIMSIVGREEVDFKIDSASTFGIGRLDVAFIFDVSGSMRSRLPALRTAAQSAVDSLIPPGTPASNNNTRIGIASYNNFLNVGPFFDQVVERNFRPAFLETSEQVGNVYEDEYIGVAQVDQLNDRNFYDFEVIRCNTNPSNIRNCSNFTDFAGRFYYDHDCVAARQGPQAFTDAAPGNGAFVRAVHPIWNAFFPGTSDFSNSRFLSKFDAQNQVLDQDGEIRNGQLNRSGDVFEVENEDGELDSTNGVSFRGFTSGDTPRNGCVEEAPIVPLTNNRNVLANFIQGLSAEGGTAGHLGVAWGWYLISPNWSNIWPSPQSTPLPYDAEDTAKAMILMSDGEFNSTFIQGEQNSTEQAAELCRNIKANTNITIFTIAFQVPSNVDRVDGTGQTVLEFCASDPEFAFDASNSQQLLEAYNSIAATISDLRLSQ